MKPIRFHPEAEEEMMILDKRGKLSLWNFEDLLTSQSKTKNYQDYK